MNVNASLPSATRPLAPQSPAVAGLGLRPLPRDCDAGSGAAAVLRLPGGGWLRRGRVHEACGPGRRLLALLAAASAGSVWRTAPPPAGAPDAVGVLWVQPGWSAERLHPPGMAGLCDPGALVFVDCTRAEDLLWTAEEALRSGAVALVVADLPEPPGLTPVRRLHLAAEAGARQAGQAPTGILLTPGQGGAQGVESRWHMTPRHGPEGSRWRLERLRARGAEPAAWELAAAGPGAAGITPAG